MRATILGVLGTLLLLPHAFAIPSDGIASDSIPVPSIGKRFFFAISVEDVDRAVSWYQKTFGLELLDDTSNEEGRWRIANLRNQELFVEIIWDPRDEPRNRPRGVRKVGFEVPDVQAVSDRIERDTGTRPQVLEFQQHGIRLIQLKDPEGNTIQLFSPLVANENPRD